MTASGIADRSEAFVLPGQRYGLAERLGSLSRFAVGVILCLTPVTAVLVLGWLMRLMHREEACWRQRLRGAGTLPRPRLPRWISAEAPASGGRVCRWLGSLLENARLGLSALATLAAGTLPFTLLWLLAWWGGWENSFNKGYEQAWVGPTLGLLGVAISLPLLARLPMAMAHQAAVGTIGAFFAWGEVRRLIRGAGWGYVGLSLLLVLAALPMLVVKGAPVFVEHWSPGFAERNAAGIEAFAGGYRLWATAYLLAVLVLLRRASARLHARAVEALANGPARRSLARGLVRAGVAVARTLLLWMIWLGLVVQVFVGQFLSHQWTAWINPPLVALPWLSPLGAVL